MKKHIRHKEFASGWYQCKCGLEAYHSDHVWDQNCLYPAIKECFTILQNTEDEAGKKVVSILGDIIKSMNETS